MERARGDGAGGKNPAICKVDGCGADLTLDTDYAAKHRVCLFHRQESSVLFEGKLSRWCQRCTRFHDAGAFDGDKKSCRASLTSLKGRRQKTKKVIKDSDEEPPEEPECYSNTSSSSLACMDTGSPNSAPAAALQRPRRQTRQLKRGNSNTSDAGPSSNGDHNPSPSGSSPHLPSPSASPFHLASPSNAAPLFGMHDFGTTSLTDMDGFSPLDAAPLTGMLGYGSASTLGALPQQHAQKNQVLQILQQYLRKPAVTRKQAGLPPEQPAINQAEPLLPLTGAMQGLAGAQGAAAAGPALQLPTHAMPPTSSSAAAEVMLLQEGQQELMPQPAQQQQGLKRPSEDLTNDVVDNAIKRLCPTFGPGAPVNSATDAIRSSTPFQCDGLMMLPSLFPDQAATTDFSLTADVAAHAQSLAMNGLIPNPPSIFPDMCAATPSLSLLFAPPASTSNSLANHTLQPLDAEPLNLFNMMPWTELDMASIDRTASEVWHQQAGTSLSMGGI